MNKSKIAGKQSPLARLRHHVTGAIERGEKQAIVAVTGSRKAASEEWAMVYNDDHHWLVGFDGGGRPIWSMNRLRGGVFAPSEIDLPNVHFIEI